MTPTQLVEQFRLDVSDTTAPYLWSTAEVWQYVNAAQWKFAKKVGVSIRDASTVAYTRLAITATSPWVALNANTTRVRSARLLSTGKSIRIMSYEELFMSPEGPSDDYGLPTSTTELDLTGPVQLALIGMEEDKLRLIRIPTVNDTLVLVVERLPLEVTELAAEPFEIRKDYHLDLLWWMKHLAYSKQDADTFDKEKAGTAEDTFYARCEEARQEAEKKNHKPRLMAYGGV